MQVYIRNIDAEESSFCGDMNFEQLELFVVNLTHSGIYDGEEHHDNICVGHQFVDDKHGFYVELIWDVI